jgi:dihydroorotate dehydrogenase (NAD+) catalytic subunit
VLAASGTFGYGVEFARKHSLEGLGALVCKGTTLEPREGNPPVRMAETPAGMLNAIGLQNIGVDAVVRDKAPIWATWRVPVLVNIAGSSIEENVEIARRLDGVPGVAGLELNISCPNVKAGGIAFGSDERMAAAVTRAVRDVSELPLVVKLTPNVTDIAVIARAVESAGADAVSLINTVYGMSIDQSRRTPLLANIHGGLSGPAVKPLALSLVYRVAQAVRVPIIGLGGIMSGRDAVEFLMAGASAVGVATLLLVEPDGWRRITQEIAEWCRDNGVRSLDEIVGAANAGYKARAGELGLTGS